MQKRKVIKDIALTSALMLLMAFGSCSSSDELPGDDVSGVPIRIASVMAGQQVSTRFSGEGSGTQATEILAGQTVWIWTDYSSNQSEYLKAWQLTAGSSGSLTGAAQTLSGSLRYYPNENYVIDLYAVQGNFPSTTIEEKTTAKPTTLVHSVRTDQYVTTSFASSDLLWGVAKNQTYTDPDNVETIVIPFKHVLSKVEVTLSLGEGEDVYTASDLRAAKVELLNVCQDISLTMANGTIGAASGDKVAITMKNENTSVGYDGDWLEAIVPPQTFEKNTPFIRVTMYANNAERPLYYQVPSDLKLTTNHRYRFSFIVSSQAVSLSGVSFEDFDETKGISPVPVP